MIIIVACCMQRYVYIILGGACQREIIILDLLLPICK
jgi:hypothetical protein